MAFLQQDALHLSDLFRHSAQQMGVTARLTLPIFDSGRLNANLDIASAQNALSIAKYNKAVVDAVNQVAKTASQMETLMAKNQQQQQVEKRCSADGRAGAGADERRDYFRLARQPGRSCRRCRSASPRCACTASGLMPASS